MSLYYQDDHVTLYHGDCLTEHREWLGADVLVTDPPYGMSYKSGFASKRGMKDIANDKSTEARDNVLRAWGDRPALAFGTWRVDKPAGVKQTPIWDKGDDPGMGDLKMPWGSYWEEIYVFGSGFIGKRRNGILRGWSGAKGNDTGHPTPKPVPLMEALIAKCPPGTIADPFAGSGSTLVAAKNLGRKAIGVELEEKYCEIIAKRLSQEVFDLGAIQ